MHRSLPTFVAVCFALLTPLLLLASACEGGDIALLVDLKTDLVSGVEFVTVRTQLFDAGDRTNELARREEDVAVGRDLTSGRRVADLENLAPGTYLVSVTLVDPAGAEVMARDIVVTATANTGVTVLMTRDCLGVTCPATGGIAAAAACLGGRCVEERCTPETPEFCPPPECSPATVGVDCTDAVSPCAARVCEDLTCFVRTDSAMCGGGEYCDPAAGCLPVESPGDGGVGDGGDAMVGPLLWAQEAYVKSSDTVRNQNFGVAVSLSADGNTMAVGAENQSVVRGPGAVYIFVRTGGAWEQQARLEASNAVAGDYFGAAVSLSADGDALAVGAPGDSSNATGVDGDQSDTSALRAGAVFLFSRTGGAWTQDAYIKASNTQESDGFGGSVSLSGDGATLAVGVPFEDSAATGVDGDQDDNSVPTSGAVYVFARSGAIWAQEAYIKASNTGFEDKFGAWVSLSADGDTLAVTAPLEDSAATGIDGDEASDDAENSGAAYVFRRSVATWTQMSYLKASNAEADDLFGSAAALSADGSTLLVGADSEGSAATGVDGDQSDNSLGSAGAAYVYTRSGDTWIQEAYLKADAPGIIELFGEVVSLSSDGSTAAICSPTRENASGAVYVFVRTGGAWSQEALRVASNADRGDYFGRAASLSGDGSTLVVGAADEDGAATGVGGDETNNDADAAGAVYVFSR